jgi:drug/metabolite transporter (DMT)-like permease
MKTKSKTVWYISAIISMTFMGSLGFFVRNISASVEIITLARFGIGLVLLTLYLLATGKSQHFKTRFSYPTIFSGFFLALAVIFYFIAIQNTTLAAAVFLLYLGPVIATILTAIFLKEKLTFLNIVLLLCAFFGFFLLLEFDYEVISKWSRGEFYGSLAALMYALTILFNRMIHKDISPYTRTFYQFISALIILIPFALINFQTVPISDYSWLFAIGLIHGFIALLLYITAIKHLKAFEFGTVSYIEPVVASGIGFMVYNESIAVLQILGGVIILGCGFGQMVLEKK